MKAFQTFINIFFLAGTVLLLIFTILTGSTNHFPFNKFYWIRADTSSIANAPSEAAWTFWGVCNYSNFSDCTLGPAFPISPVDNFKTHTNVPEKFITDRDTFYYLTRFSFAFIIVAIAFTGFALIIDIMGLFFSAIDKVVVALMSVGLFFLAGTAAFQTAAVVMARNAFESDNLSVHVGLKQMAILWTSLVTLLLAFFNASFGTIRGSYKKHLERVRSDEYVSGPATIPQGTGADDSSFTRSAPVDTESKQENSGGIRFFKIKRNQKASDEESV